MSSTKWKALSEKTLATLDIQAEYTRLGIGITGNKPSATGWLACRAKGREDKHASAAINVGDTPSMRGRYRDHGGEGDTLSLWDFAAKYGPHGDWK